MGRTVLSALAEIGIIVIGVLIALAVDRWKESRRDRALERHYLKGLENDLKHDRLRLETYLREIQEALDATKTVLRIIRGEPPPKSEILGREVVRAGYGHEPVYALATYTELVHGNLHLIRSESLKRQVVEYYSGLVTGEKFEARVTPQMWYDVAIEPYAKKVVEILPPGDWVEWNTEGPSDLDVGALAGALRADPEIERHLEACRRIRALQLAEFRIHEDQAVSLLEAVNAELSHLSS
jgi:hypothetical protein